MRMTIWYRYVFSLGGVVVRRGMFPVHELAAMIESEGELISCEIVKMTADY